MLSVMYPKHSPWDCHICLHCGGFGGQCRHIWQSHGVFGYDFNVSLCLVSVMPVLAHSIRQNPTPPRQEWDERSGCSKGPTAQLGRRSSTWLLVSPLHMNRWTRRLLGSKPLALREAGPRGLAASCEAGVRRPLSLATLARHL